MFLRALVLLISFAAATALPWALMRAGFLASRFVEGVCGRCGYSLRGLPTPVCPECGADSLVVGTRRQVGKSRRGYWIAAAAWVLVVYTFGTIWQWEIDAWLLRAVWGIRYYSGTLLASGHYPDPAPLRRSMLAALALGGSILILWLHRRRRGGTAA
jgi:hypothetical protein